VSPTGKALNKNETDYRKCHENNANDSKKYRDAEAETAGWSFGPDKLGQLDAGTAHNISQDIRDNQTYDEPTGQ